MAERQAGQHRCAGLAAQPVHHRLQLEALVVRPELVAVERAEQHRFLFTQDAGVQQLGQLAFDAVRVLVHIFEEQHAALDARQPGRADQRAQHREVAAPQRGVAHLERGLSFGRSAAACRQGRQIGLGQLPARALALAADEVVETRFHDVIGRVLGAKVFAQCRPGPADGTGLGQQRALQGGEVAQAHELRAFGNGLGDLFVGQVRQDAREPVAAARDQRNVGAAGGGPAHGSDAGAVVARETHVAGQRRLVDFHLVPQLLQALDATSKGGFVAHGAGGGIDVDVAHGCEEWCGCGGAIIAQKKRRPGARCPRSAPVRNGRPGAAGRDQRRHGCRRAGPASPRRPARGPADRRP